MSWVTELARPDIVALKPYEHASWEPTLERLHANELPWRPGTDDSAAGLNRYPEPQPHDLVEGLASLYGVAPKCVLVGRGSDEAIDLLTRAFCRAGRDAVLVCPPTFGMYAVSARIQGADVITVPLSAESGFAIDEKAILERCAPEVKLVYFCSPNNPTGNLLDEEAILRIAGRLAGRAVVVVDEAYIEFAPTQSLARHLPRFPHLAILRTLSKAHGLAGARCGTLIADPEVVALLRKVIPPYAITQLTLEAVLKQLQPAQLARSRANIESILAERERLAGALPQLARVVKVWPSDANFILAQFTDAGAALQLAREARLLVRDARGYPGLGQALRISVGTAAQNNRLLEAWQ
ncbi:MAG TPA: histidinol-phosphate transaminase [Steroidobacteraceae bacterium]|nr:histidinol-phosphate transaminase [Steroidobacteraceae bacterium]